ncbi:MAG: response regulator [Desulfosarcinaceae bacterium]|nr:response regulator [Desulfosarcinaceae bacterium]
MDGAASQTLLFVDDEDTILDIAEEFFTNRGFRVLTASNGRAAVEVLDREKVDCCFTDINMPEMDGLALAEHIHEKDNTLPVVVMTGYPSLDATIRTLQNGVVDFLVKPVDLKQMELCVHRVLRERDLFARNLILAKEAESAARLKELNQELLYKVEELNILNQIMMEFATISTSRDVFKRVVDTALDLSHGDEACFFVLNEKARHPVAVARSLGGEQMPDTCLGIPASRLDKTVAAEVEAFIVTNSMEENPLLISHNNGNGPFPASISAFMLVPLMIREKIFGSLAVVATDPLKRFSEKDLYYLSFMTNKAAYAIENLALYENIYDNLFATLYAFVKAIEARDPYTEQHSNRVTSLAIAVARAMGLSSEEVDILNVAGRLHDIGKIGIRDEILLKPGRLTNEEYDIIKLHPIIGADIVAQMGLWDREKQIIRAHHERFDGGGYPDGLAGEKIPLLGRILSVADVYDAIASDRAYRSAMPEEKILGIMYGGAGSQFDPQVIEVFRRLYEDGTIRKISEEYLQEPEATSTAA